MFKRTISSRLQQAVNEFPVTYVVGPRQSGKTTLVKELFPEFTYVLLEAPDVLLEVKADPRAFLQRKAPGIIFDEAQLFPELFSYIQDFADQSERKVPIILSGSQNFLLFHKISQSLAGRAAIIELMPLTCSELISDEQFAQLNLFQFLFSGTYPRPYHEHLDVKTWYDSYLRTYLERDVRTLLNIGDLSQFQMFLKLCAGHHAQLVNFTEMAGACGVSQTTAMRWLSVLEASYIIFKTQPYFKNFNKRTVKTPKLYFYDSSLVCGLLGIDSPQHLSVHSSRGSVFEGFVMSEMKKRLMIDQSRAELYFFRDHSGLEVDGVIDHAGELFGFEIKSGQTLTEDFFANLVKWQKITKAPRENLALFYGGDDQRNVGGIQTFPWKKVDSWPAF